MVADEPRVRLRQAVLVAAELEPMAEALRTALHLEEPFRDPGVGLFGLENTVFAIGDCFLEIVSPTQADTAAGRQLARQGGDGGYMAIFDLTELDGARERAAALGVRVVWQVDLADISATHMHPADMRGTIVSLDRSQPYGSWRWGGPQWLGQIGSGPPGRLAGISLAVAEPRAAAARWGEVLGLPVAGGEQPLLALEGAEVRFEPLRGRAEGLVEIAVETPHALPARADSIEFGALRLRRVAGA